MPSFGRQALLALALSMESMFAVIAFLPLQPDRRPLFYREIRNPAQAFFLFVGCWYVLQPSFELDEWHREVPKKRCTMAAGARSLSKLDAPVPSHCVYATNSVRSLTAKVGSSHFSVSSGSWHQYSAFTRVLNVDEV